MGAHPARGDRRRSGAERLPRQDPLRPSTEATRHGGRAGARTARAYVGSISIEGFRGIGPAATLTLRPGPGLTLVVGRNGSGKSSFAEGLAYLLTGRNYRMLREGGSGRPNRAEHGDKAAVARGLNVAGIIELLQRSGLQQIANVKIVRHRDTRYDIEELIARGHFEQGYQAYQRRRVFNCDYIVSCIGLPDLGAVLWRGANADLSRPETGAHSCG